MMDPQLSESLRTLEVNYRNAERALRKVQKEVQSIRRVKNRLLTAIFLLYLIGILLIVGGVALIDRAGILNQDPVPVVQPESPPIQSSDFLGEELAGLMAAQKAVGRRESQAEMNLALVNLLIEFQNQLDRLLREATGEEKPVLEKKLASVRLLIDREYAKAEENVGQMKADLHLAQAQATTLENKALTAQNTKRIPEQPATSSTPRLVSSYRDWRSLIKGFLGLGLVLGGFVFSVRSRLLYRLYSDESAAWEKATNLWNKRLNESNRIKTEIATWHKNRESLAAQERNMTASLTAIINRLYRLALLFGKDQLWQQLPQIMMEADLAMQTAKPTGSSSG